MTDGSRVEELLAERPDLESALEEVADVDADHETWTFDDLTIDSGAFGQLVSENVVEKANGEYQLADPDAVRVALGEEVHEDSITASDSGVSAPEVSLSAPTVDFRAAGLLASVLAVLALVRFLPFGSIFRDGNVVLSGNDPYAYLFSVEQIVADGGVGLLPVGELPGSAANAEPLLVATLVWLSGLFGGVSASSTVLALYPPVTAILTGLMVYALTVRVTEDRRVALAAVLMLAVSPGHAFRTSLGYADHHAFDYLWLTLTALALTLLLTGDRDRPHLDPGYWLAVAGLGVGIAGQVLAWDSGPLLVVPVAIVVTLGVLLDVRSGRSPLATYAPVLAGIALAAIAVFAVHTTVGWHSTTVAGTPALLLAGSVAVVAVGELAVRLDRDVRELAVAELAAGGGTVAALALLFPDYWSQLQFGISRILRQDAIAETQSLFNDAIGFLLVFGFILVFAVVGLVWASARLAKRDEKWLVPVVYGWFFLGLAVFQVRFVGELSPFTALFAGFTFVWLAAWVDVLPHPTPFDGVDRTDWLPDRPERSTVVALFAVFLLVGGLGVMQSAVKINQVTIDDDSYETASYLAEYADERGWEGASESAVFSDWGRNRMYNYVVSGDVRPYSYSHSNYREFVVQQDTEAAANRVDSGNVRFVVTQSFDLEAGTMGASLHDHYGSRYNDTDGLSRYRALYATENGDHKAFLVVPGARLNGTTEPNATVSLSTDVSVPNASFTYDRQVQTDANGDFSVAVAYPGTYELETDDDTWTVEVAESAVMDGETAEAST